MHGRNYIGGQLEVDSSLLVEAGSISAVWGAGGVQCSGACPRHWLVPTVALAGLHRAGKTVQSCA